MTDRWVSPRALRQFASAKSSLRARVTAESTRASVEHYWTDGWKCFTSGLSAPNLGPAPAGWDSYITQFG